jgi:hypothetical protein
MGYYLFTGRVWKKEPGKWQAHILGFSNAKPFQRQEKIG